MTQLKDQRDQGLVDPLEALFAQARGQAVEPSPDFLGRLLEDAYAAQPPMPAAPPVLVRQEAAASRLMQWLRRLAPPAGLATAALSGFWVGFAQPASLMAPVSSVKDVVAGSEEVVEMVDLIPSLDGWLSEG